ncbi:MAG: hypothetical protein QG602_1473 [Verrucomicrobiota bacterium]|nr:hypothetical protein [Verrucomicrobiota bacterium]
MNTHSRLLSFLADFERALLADDPAPDDGNWQCTRTVNYHNGLARLQLAVRMPDSSLKPRGTILLQGYNLADGTNCLKAHLGWTGSEASPSRSIFSKPGSDWKSEARRLAAEWMAGAPAAPIALVEETALPATAEAVV